MAFLFSTLWAHLDNVTSLCPLLTPDPLVPGRLVPSRRRLSWGGGVSAGAVPPHSGWHGRLALFSLVERSQAAWPASIPAPPRRLSWVSSDLLTLLCVLLVLGRHMPALSCQTVLPLLSPRCHCCLLFSFPSPGRQAVAERPSHCPRDNQQRPPPAVGWGDGQGQPGSHLEGGLWFSPSRGPRVSRIARREHYRVTFHRGANQLKGTKGASSGGRLGAPAQGWGWGACHLTRLQSCGDKAKPRIPRPQPPLTISSPSGAPTGWSNRKSEGRGAQEVQVAGPWASEQAGGGQRVTHGGGGQGLAHGERWAVSHLIPGGQGIRKRLSPHA